MNVIRVWIEDGLVAGVQGLPPDTVLRVIDTDCEGADESDTQQLKGADRARFKVGSRAFVTDWENVKP